MKKNTILFFMFCFAITELFSLPDFSMKIQTGKTIKSGIMNPIERSHMNPLKGHAGEYFTNVGYVERMRRTGWFSNTPRTGEQGLDHLLTKFKNGLVDDVMIVDSKFTNKPIEKSLGQSKSGKQMSKSWCVDNLKDYEGFIEQFVDAEKSGAVEYTNKRLKKNILVKAVAIDEDVIYYEDSTSGKKYLYDPKCKYPEADDRIKQANRTKTGVKTKVERGDFKRRLVQFKYDANAKLLYEIPYGIVDEKGVDIIISIEKNKKSYKGKALEKFLESGDTIDYLKKTYGLDDFDFYSGLRTEQKLQLVQVDVDDELAKKMLSTEKNRNVLNNKLGLEPDTDLANCKLNETDWKKILRAENYAELKSELPAESMKKVRNAEMKAVAKSFGKEALIVASAAAAGNIINQLLIQKKSLSEIDFTSVGIAAGVGVASEGLHYGIEYAARTATRKLAKKTASSSGVKMASKLSKASPLAFNFAADAIMDIGFGMYGYFKGTYSGKQTMANVGLNMGFDVASYFAGTAIAGAVKGAIAGTVGGFIGTGVGFLVGGAISFGSYYVVNPIMNSIEVADLYKAIRGSDHKTVIFQWTRDYLEN